MPYRKQLDVRTGLEPRPTLAQINFSSVGIFGTESHVFEANIGLRDDNNFNLVFVFYPDEFLAFSVVQVIGNPIMHFDHDFCHLLVRR